MGTVEDGDLKMAGIEAVDPRYVDLLARAHEVLDADPRVARLEVAGSIGDGSADQWSDLDLHVYVRVDDHAAVVAEWPTWVAAITPAVFARTPILPFIVNTVTADGLTLDFAILREDTPPFVQPTGFAVGLLSGQRYADHGGAVEYAVAEMLRGTAGPFVSFLERGEHVRHIAGCGHILGLLTTVMLAETESPPANGKLLNSFLTDEQRACLESLPPLRATRADVAAFGLAVAGEVLRRARPLFTKYNLTWPTELEAVARDRVASIGLELLTV
jgi:hypothetical protein